MIKTSSPDAYTVLSLPSSSQSYLLSNATIKEAYRNALLVHHPDKRSGNNEYVLNPKIIKTIDAITEAYRLLSTPELRSQLDKKLATKASIPGPSKGDDEQVAVEADSIDLDDMLYDADSQSWSCKCRCGIDDAFVVRSNDLEENEAAPNEQSELLVACQGCTLWLRISYIITLD